MRDATSFDAIVVGSGITGGYAAMELTRKGLRTLVLERGPMVRHIADYPTATTPPWGAEYPRVDSTGRVQVRVKAPDADAYAFGDWILRTGERELVDTAGRAVPLSTGEYNLLLAFVTHPKRVLTRDQRLDLSQHRELGAFERSVDNHISRLRRKLEADPKKPALIKTVWGGGYTLAADVRRI